jgi:nickel-dependent lactate racemase
MTSRLKCGRGTISLDLPGQWDTRTLEPKHPPHRPPEETLMTSLSRPIGEKPLAEWLPGKDVLIVVPDVTRYMGAESLLPLLCEHFLNECNVEILFALGNHRKQTEAEKRGIVSDSVYNRFPCIDHDCFDPGVMTALGSTPSGLEILVNTALLQKDCTIVMGSISFHYLAGYGGGRKALFPGISGYDTILGVHKRVFLPDRPGKHPKVRPGILDGNPMHEETIAALSLVKRPLFLINTVVDDEKNLLNIFAGDMREAHRAGCDWYAGHFGVHVDEKADVAIVSTGGYPKDIDFIQTHKALDHAQAAVKDGGTIILVGKCEDGIGNPHFLKWFDYPTSEEMEPFVRESDKVYAQTAYATRLKAERFNVVLVSDLDDQDVRKMGLIPKKSLADAVSSIDAERDLLCYVIPEGSKTLIF